RGSASSSNRRPSRAYGGYARQNPSPPRKSGRPESTPMPAPAQIRSAPAPSRSSAALASSLTRLRAEDDLELQQVRPGGHRLGALARVRRRGRAALRPRLVVLLGLPLRVHEVARLAGNRAQQLEAEEARLLIDRVHPGGEPLFQLGAGAL